MVEMYTCTTLVLKVETDLIDPRMSTENRAPMSDDATHVEPGEEYEEGEEEGQGEEEGELDPEDLYCQPVEELAAVCTELNIDRSGTRHELATRILDELESREAVKAEREAEARRMLGPGLPCTVLGGARRVREAGSVRNERLRGSLSWEERVEEGERLKELANAQFKAGAHEIALAAYLAAVWLLKPENPPSPDSLASGIWSVRSEHPFCPSPPPTTRTPRGFESVLLLGEGASAPSAEASGGGGDGDGEGRDEWMRWCASREHLQELGAETGCALGVRTVELRLSLHLNVASAALRLEDWELADGACAYVLRRRVDEPRALYRQAAALKGSGDLKRAARLLERLLALPGQARHADARRLHAEVAEAHRTRAQERQASLAAREHEMVALREKLEAEAAQKKADERARVEAEEARKVARAKELADATQVRAPPQLGSRIEVWWEGDAAWSAGEVVERLGDEGGGGPPRFRVRYDDDFSMVHDLTSSDRAAMPFRLVAPPPTATDRLCASLLGQARAKRVRTLVRAARSRVASPSGRPSLLLLLLLLGSIGAALAIAAARLD